MSTHASSCKSTDQHHRNAGTRDGQEQHCIATLAVLHNRQQRSNVCAHHCNGPHECQEGVRHDWRPHMFAVAHALRSSHTTAVLPVQCTNEALERRCSARQGTDSLHSDTYSVPVIGLFTILVPGGKYTRTAGHQEHAAVFLATAQRGARRTDAGAAGSSQGHLDNQGLRTGPSRAIQSSQAGRLAQRGPEQPHPNVHRDELVKLERKRERVAPEAVRPLVHQVHVPDGAARELPQQQLPQARVVLAGAAQREEGVAAVAAEVRRQRGLVREGAPVERNIVDGPLRTWRAHLSQHGVYAAADARAALPLADAAVPCAAHECGNAAQLETLQAQGMLLATVDCHGRWR